MAQKLIFMQGVGPSLHQSISSAARLASAIPAVLRDYLANQLVLNSLRIERIHTELAAILAKASRMGIEVMPLKGSLLTTQGQIDARLRPMADIDLLIRPNDRQAIGRLLEVCGYRQDAPTTFYVHHDCYSRPQDYVASREGEHPDNPIPIEVHTSLRRILWGDYFIPDLSTNLWENAYLGVILGQPALIPDGEAHYAYLVIHALVHLIAYQGRLTHWLDVAQLAPMIPDFSRLPHPNLLYPVIRLASRALPGTFRGTGLSAMADLAQPRVRHWANYIPLNGHCGLLDHFRTLSWIEGRWEYWHPNVIRLSLAYPETPLPAAAALFLGNFTLHLAKRGGNLLAGRGRS